MFFWWFVIFGVDEEIFCVCIYMVVVCCCFFGKNLKGGDCVFDFDEIFNCLCWFKCEFEFFEFDLVLFVGKFVIQQLLFVKKLVDVVGQQFFFDFYGQIVDVILFFYFLGVFIWYCIFFGVEFFEQVLELIVCYFIFVVIVVGFVLLLVFGD